MEENKVIDEYFSEEQQLLTPTGEKTMAVGELVDKFFKLNAERLELDRQSKEIKETCDALKVAIIAEMNSQNVESLGGKMGTVTLKKGVAHPRISDKDAFVNFLEQNNDFSMAVISVNKAAFTEYYSDKGIYPDGIDVYYEDTLNTRKK